MSSFAWSVAVVLGTYLILRLRKGELPPLPPGPKGFPIIGNLFDMPTTYIWMKFAKYRELYGPISSLSILGRTFIILNDHKAALELLDKRSLNYSDRNSSPFARLAGIGKVTTLLSYGPALASHRRNFHRFVGNKEALLLLHPIEELETRRFIRRIMAEPDMVYEKIRLLAGSIILRIVYGYNVDTTKLDPLVTLADEAIRISGQALQPGKWLIDFFPPIQHFPDWMPGSYSKRMAHAYKKVLDKYAYWPHNFTKQQMAKGVAPVSYDSFLMEGNPSPEEENLIAWSGVSLYSGGADTTVSAISSFFLVMQLYPEVQRKAQAEIDAVVGQDRLPKLADRPNLPYVEAVVKEILRWNVIVPFGVPHVSREDDTYEGYMIPRGSTIIFNTWYSSRDPDVYAEPDSFDPERFLFSASKEPELDPQTYTFGYGRRICPGKDMAMSSIFIAIAMILATLDIQKAQREDGSLITPEYQATDNLSSHPKSFPYAIAPRSAKAKDLVFIVDLQEEGFNPEGDADILREVPIYA